MPAPNVFHFLQRSTALRRYRALVQRHMRNERAIRLFPNLPSLPLLSTTNTDSGAVTDAIYHSLVVVRGVPGSGRSLMLLQLAHEWLAGRSAEPTLYLPLAYIDDPQRAPSTLLEEAFKDAGLPSPLDRLPMESPTHPWLLLFDEWEELTAPRQAVWQSFILNLPHLWSDVQIVVAAPADCADWTGFQIIDLLPPDDAALRRWLGHLLPRHDLEPLLTALQPGTSLATLRHRLGDIALLALTYPHNGLPISRGQLYSWTANLLTTMPPYERSRWSFGIGQMAHLTYEIAHKLVMAGSFMPPDDLSELVRTEVALLLTSMVSDPEPFYAELWHTRQHSPANLLLLAHCLCERPDAASEWLLRVLEALLDYQNSLPHRRILSALAPLLPSVLVSRATDPTIGYETDSLANDLLSELTSFISGPSLLALVYNITLPSDVRWAAGNALLRLPTGVVGVLQGAAQPPDTLAQAICCFALALGNAESRRMLAASPALHWFKALGSAEISEQQRSLIVNTLLQEADTPALLRTTVLTLTERAVGYTYEANQVLLQACTDSAATVRQAAFTTLQYRTAQEVLKLLQNILLSPEYSWEAQQDALELLSTYQQGEASLLLAHCVVASHLPLAIQLQALHFLASRPAAKSVLLPRLLSVGTVHRVVRATIIRLLAQEGESGVLPALCQLATNNAPLLLRQSAIEALGILGQQPDLASQVYATLSIILTHELGNPVLAISAIQALGNMQQIEAVPILRTLLQTNISHSVRAMWLSHAPALANVPVSRWHDVELPSDLRVLLLTLLTEGETDADPPGSLDEFVVTQDRRIHLLTAEALARIGSSATSALQQQIRTILITLIQQTPPGWETRRLLTYLTWFSEDAGLSDLGRLLAHPSIEPALRWLVIEQLADNPASSPLLLRYLEEGLFDPFTLSKLAYTLGQHRSLAALPVLRQLAEQRSGDFYLRMQAIIALGLLADPAVETTLLHIVADVTTAPALRGAAAEALSHTLRPELRHWLYQLLRRERQPSELIVGVLRALGHAQDRDALGLMIHYMQSDHAAVAIAALTALAELGDTGVIPSIIRITQNTARDQSVRLHAVTTLLQLCGHEYLSLLRGYLDSNVLLLQLQALDCLLSLCPEDDRPLMLLTHKNAPLALRLRSVEALTNRVSDHGVLCAVLLDTTDELHLRSATTTILGQTEYPDAIATLGQCIREDSTPFRLRRRCIEALHRQAAAPRPNASGARLLLSQLVDDSSQPDENRMWAAQALVALPLETKPEMNTTHKDANGRFICG